MRCRWSDDFDGDMTRAQGIVDRALMIQSDSSMLHNANADLLGYKGQWQAAIAEKERAITYDRNNALARTLRFLIEVITDGREKL